MTDANSIMIVVAVLSVGVALGALMLTSLHRMEARLNKRIDDAIADGKSDNAALEVRSNARFDEAKELNQVRFDEAREQSRAMQARTDKGFDDVAEELRTTNARMASIEQRQARLEGLLDGLREALFQRVQQ